MPRPTHSHAQHARRARGGRAHASRHRGEVTGGHGQGLFGVSCGVHMAIDPRCASRRSETLYVVLKPIQSRPTCSACAWWPCSGLPLARWGSGGWHPADIVRCTCVVRAEAIQRARGWLSCVRGHLLCAWGLEHENSISEAGTEPPAGGTGRRSGRRFAHAGWTVNVACGGTSHARPRMICVP